MITLTYGGVKFFVIAYHRLRKVYLMEYLIILVIFSLGYIPIFFGNNQVKYKQCI